MSRTVHAAIAHRHRVTEASPSRGRAFRSDPPRSPWRVVILLQRRRVEAPGSRSEPIDRSDLIDAIYILTIPVTVGVRDKLVWVGEKLRLLGCSIPVVDIGIGYSREESNAISGRRRSRSTATVTRASDRAARRNGYPPF